MVVYYQRYLLVRKCHCRFGLFVMIHWPVAVRYPVVGDDDDYCHDAHDADRSLCCQVGCLGTVSALGDSVVVFGTVCLRPVVQARHFVGFVLYHSFCLESALVLVDGVAAAPDAAVVLCFVVVGCVVVDLDLVVGHAVLALYHVVVDRKSVV